MPSETLTPQDIETVDRLWEDYLATFRKAESIEALRNAWKLYTDKLDELDIFPSLAGYRKRTN